MPHPASRRRSVHPPGRERQADDSPGFDHLGLLQDSRAEVDGLLEACKRYQEKDDRVLIQEYEDLVYPQLTVHAFYVKYLLPIYFDVQSMERS